MAEQIRGLTAPLTEEGYQRVADLRNDAEMSLYIHRVAASLGRKVTNLGDLGGFAPFFSGTTQVQSLAQMQAELAGKDFVAEGVEPEFEASLTEDGYQKVAALKDDGKMAHFIRRVCAAEVRRVIDEDGLNGFSPFFSGTTSVQTLEKMREEIRGSSWSEVYAPPELAAWMAGAPQPRFPHAFSLVPSKSEPGKFKLRLACIPGGNSSLVAIHYAVNAAEPSACCPMNFETGQASPGEGPKTFVVESPEGAGYPDVQPGSKVTYWIGVIDGPIIEMPERGHEGQRYTWQASWF
mmetsp:Transcript_2934/g.6390  ORF Transcript_2934/g.6390 Transcript_2934/m.6390 type:complete len:293 (+) Transcript_2934:74-952(+)|eukprot:CAMPEP_0178429180 /NCGR_PEP_ID=MMETSP0689_2-20121128/30668_1 /TAXON_ID=160604 /ORGANISM="Amphidinium massartii, Strain CS-259" /LENGTH=292 /DNA_ID=CAMNT_0020050991 /DNA_START=63 /DNA_END=941 /DNA_ORIENTATION=+